MDGETMDVDTAGGESAGASATAQHGLRGCWFWLLPLGVLLIVGGLIALAAPMLTAMAATKWIGVAFAIGGAAQLLQAVSARGWRGVTMRLLEAVVFLVGAFILIFKPLEGVVALAVIAAAMMLASGFIEIAAGFQVRREAGWLWLVGGGALSAMAGLALLLLNPADQIAFLGFIVAAALIVEGLGMLGLAFAVRKACRS
ncbi:MAG: hypothetical protein EA355_16170 [Rhodobacteraceae bacterium]|nr:MAG: hypothetical protein EA355_16170 [Paracoccaceae bacterium]